MRSSTFVLRLVLLVLVVLPGGSVGASEGSSAVAVVVDTEGPNVRVAGAESRELHRFDWIVDGEELRVAEDGSLTLAFADGRRFRLEDGASAMASVAGLGERSGAIEELEAVPTLPPLAAASTGNELARPAAMRLRGATSQHLYPDVGSRAPADETVLRFAAVPGAERYRIELEDEEGEVIFGTETADTEVAVPADVLAPGSAYWWSLRSEDRSGRSAGGWWAQLETLSRADAESRRKLADALGSTPDRSERALLAEVDCRLGLLVRCLESLEALRDDDPASSPDLDRRIAELRRTLAGG